MGWKIIEIDSPAIIKTFLNNLLIFKENKIIIPINDIDVLMISDTRTTLTVNTINEIVKNGACVILCDNKKIPVSYILGYKVQKQSYITFKKQLEWDNEFKSNCWNWILRQKINNQLNFLNYLQINTNEFIDYNTSSLTEAKIASFFFKSLYGRSFNRNKDLLINNLLDYGYVILTNMVARSITKKV